ncbi:MAG: hypothetical protein CME60_05905 [Halobacteriovoraceae bacterium]|jgi:hypothetical protein|nr:hypothetical protein [Halobacteriovoraceae bacterium]|tara:strand:- start:1973 stop:2749 length:777 start_codon:yes stop_codon:yes gene_type:complete
MKFALINDQKHIPKPGLRGKCPGCGEVVIAKCGEQKVWHWAHFKKRTCDIWWENETEWHRNWKNLFPEKWQEIVHFDGTGEKHIADVKTNHKWVIEFQHSFLNREEKVKRSTFYNKIVWIIDGTRRSTDIKQFQKALEDGSSITVSVPIRKVFIDECRLIKEWISLNKPIFLDFKEPNRVWMVIPEKGMVNAYVIPFSKDELVRLHNDISNEDEFGKFIKDFPELVYNFENRKRVTQIPFIPTRQRRNFRRARRIRKL